MASIADLLNAKNKGNDDHEKNNKPQKKVKLKKVKLIKDDVRPQKNYRDNYGRGGQRYGGGGPARGRDELPTQHPHSYYTQNYDIPKAAVAPYNFIPFTQAVLASPLNEMADDFQDYLTSQKTYSGDIQLHLKTLTPLFIGDGSEDFFSPAGMPIIPGSTLRGMVRNLFKIITAGTMRPGEDFVDRHLYYRCLMAPRSMPQLNELHDAYVNRMSRAVTNSKGKKVVVKNGRPGFLFRKMADKKYYISPCDMKSLPLREYGRLGRESAVSWQERSREVYIETGNQREKKYVRYLFNPDWQQEYQVPDDVIQDYRDDKNRRGVDLLDEKSRNTKTQGAARAFAQRDDIDFLAPCFYTFEDDKVTSFGHGRSYRIPYHHSVGARLPRVQKENQAVVDFADAVFGDKDRWAGRVSFEDALLQNGPDFAAKEWVRPLLGANPTSFQMYLTQTDYPPAHWDSDAPSTLRGYKMYWHKQISDKDWHAPKGMQNDKITKKIRPLEPLRQFTSVIHFHQLTAIELGALLKVFHLADGEKDYDIAYKLGMGKSLGLGSVRITADLQLDDGGRYNKLFTDNGWQESQVDADITPFLKAFDQYAAEHLSEKKYYEKSLEALKMMLNWKNTTLDNWNQRTRTAMGKVKDDGSLDGGVDEQFKQRAVLPTPDKVINKK